MARRRKKTRKEITNYAHTDEQRVNNPPVGLVTPDTDKDTGQKGYAYDPHLESATRMGWEGRAHIL